MTAYRDRMNAGEYDPAKKDSASKAAATRAAKSTTSAKGKRSSK